MYLLYEKAFFTSYPESLSCQENLCPTFMFDRNKEFNPFFRVINTIVGLISSFSKSPQQLVHQTHKLSCWYSALAICMHGVACPYTAVKTTDVEVQEFSINCITHLFTFFSYFIKRLCLLRASVVASSHPSIHSLPLDPYMGSLRGWSLSQLTVGEGRIVQ